MLRHCRAFLFLSLLNVQRGVSEFVLAGLIDRVDPHLVEVNEEDDIVAETRNTMQHGHLDNERKHIIDEGVQRLVDHGVDRDVGDALQLVVDEQLRRHRDEAYARTLLSSLPNRYTKLVSEVMIQSYHDLCVS